MNCVLRVGPLGWTRLIGFNYLLGNPVIEFGEGESEKDAEDKLKGLGLSTKDKAEIFRLAGVEVEDRLEAQLLVP